MSFCRLPIMLSTGNRITLSKVESINSTADMELNFSGASWTSVARFWLIVLFTVMLEALKSLLKGRRNLSCLFAESVMALTDCEKSKHTSRCLCPSHNLSTSSLQSRVHISSKSSEGIMMWCFSDVVSRWVMIETSRPHI